MRRQPHRSAPWLRGLLILLILGNAWFGPLALQEELVELHRFAEQKLYSFERTREEVTTAGSGEVRVLSRPVLAMVAMLRGHGVEGYRVSEGVAASPYDAQRLAEAAWPIRNDPESYFEISFLTEETDCQVLDSQRIRRRSTSEDRGVRLARCP